MEVLSIVKLGRWFRWGFSALLLLIPLTASAQELDEYAVKAAFLYNFTKFVEWPSSGGQVPFLIFKLCILGDDPFGPALDQAVRGKTGASGRPMEVRRIKDPAEARQCQIVFVKKQEEDKAAKNRATALDNAQADWTKEFDTLKGLIS